MNIKETNVWVSRPGMSYITCDLMASKGMGIEHFSSVTRDFKFSFYQYKRKVYTGENIKVKLVVNDKKHWVNKI